MAVPTFSLLTELGQRTSTRPRLALIRICSCTFTTLPKMNIVFVNCTTSFLSHYVRIVHMQIYKNRVKRKVPVATIARQSALSHKNAGHIPWQDRYCTKRPQRRHISSPRDLQRTQLLQNLSTNRVPPTTIFFSSTSRSKRSISHRIT